MLDIERAEKFIAVLDQASAFPLFDASRRLVLSHDMAVVALEFAASVRMHGACLIACMHIGILSGVAGIQKDLIGLSAGFASVLPKLR